MAARKATETLHITPEAKLVLDRRKRTLAARVDANVDFSQAVLYMDAITDATHARLETRRANGQAADTLDRAIELIDDAYTEGGKS